MNLRTRYAHRLPMGLRRVFWRRTIFSPFMWATWTGFFWDDLHRFLSSRLASAPAAPGVTLLYFTYAPDFIPLKQSLASVTALRSRHIRAVVVVMDRRSPLSAAQQAELRGSTSLAIRFRTSTHGLRQYSLRYIAAQANEYFAFARSDARTEWFAKVDSDVYFFSDEIFKVVVESKNDMVGHSIDNVLTQPKFPYLQGGCYFFRTAALEKMRRTSLARVSMHAWLRHPFQVWVAEDCIFTGWAKAAGLRLQLELFHVYPPHPDFLTLDQVVSRNPKSATRFSLIHFTGQKDKMGRAAEYVPGKRNRSTG